MFPPVMIMPRLADARLTDQQLKRMPKPTSRVEIADGIVKSLYLIVQPSGVKSGPSATAPRAINGAPRWATIPASGLRMPVTPLGRNWRPMTAPRSNPPGLSARPITMPRRRLPLTNLS